MKGINQGIRVEDCDLSEEAFVQPAITRIHACPRVVLLSFREEKDKHVALRRVGETDPKVWSASFEVFSVHTCTRVCGQDLR
uniref:50S ribosomal protein L23 n=2 Tax=Steinernema glaseri TaxID=37863 RepID=A0A1I7ZM18_9BILA